MQNDFIPGLFIGGIITACIAIMLCHSLTQTKIREDAIRHGVGKYILATPTSTEVTFVWVTNRSE